MTLGYSGSYASGFPDDLAFEQWLVQLETMAEDHERLQQGEHVSGPAAATYRQRVNAATRFVGRVLRTTGKLPPSSPTLICRSTKAKA